MRQNPQTLYQMAVAYHRLGHAREAVDRYRRFLATGAATEAQRVEAETALRLLGGLVQAAPPSHLSQAGRASTWARA